MTPPPDDRPARPDLRAVRLPDDVEDAPPRRRIKADDVKSDDVEDAPVRKRRRRRRRKSKSSQAVVPAAAAVAAEDVQPRPAPTPALGRAPWASCSWCSAPFVATTAYLYTRAADQYHSEVAFSIRSEEVGNAAAGLLGALTSIGKGTASDTDILFEYIRSQEIVQAIDAKLDLRAIWNRAGYRLANRRSGLHPGR